MGLVPVPAVVEESTQMMNVHGFDGCYGHRHHHAGSSHHYAISLKKHVFEFDSETEFVKVAKNLLRDVEETRFNEKHLRFRFPIMPGTMGPKRTWGRRGQHGYMNCLVYPFIIGLDMPEIMRQGVISDAMDPTIHNGFWVDIDEDEARRFRLTEQHRREICRNLPPPPQHADDSR